MPRNLPERLVRLMRADEIDVDVSQRILRRCHVTTRCLASDGGIVMPEGLEMRFHDQNPVVLNMHGYTDGFPVVGRCIEHSIDDHGMVCATQFADTERGRELAYLYGVNDNKDVYARAWSLGWDSVEVEWWDLEKARQWLGSDWDENLVPAWMSRQSEVWVAKRSIVNEYSVVALGADRQALTRAFRESNIRLAGEMIADIDLTEARQKLTAIERTQTEDRARLERMERDIQALRRDGASAAARRDSEAMRDELGQWLSELRRR